jgi:hypothetical protein
MPKTPNNHLTVSDSAENPDAAGVRDGDGADVADEEVHALEHQAAPRVLRVVVALAVGALRARVLGALAGVGAPLAGVTALGVVGVVPAVCGAFTGGLGVVFKCARDWRARPSLCGN